MTCMNDMINDLDNNCDYSNCCPPAASYGANGCGLGANGCGFGSWIWILLILFYAGQGGYGGNNGCCCCQQQQQDCCCCSGNSGNNGLFGACGGYLFLLVILFLCNSCFGFGGNLGVNQAGFDGACGGLL